MGLLDYSAFCEERYGEKTKDWNFEDALEQTIKEKYGKHYRVASELPINNFTIVDWMKVPGIGKTLATRLVEHAPYDSPDAVIKVKGVSKRIFDKLDDVLTQPVDSNRVQVEQPMPQEVVVSEDRGHDQALEPQSELVASQK